MLFAFAIEITWSILADNPQKSIIFMRLNNL